MKLSSIAIALLFLISSTAVGQSGKEHATFTAKAVKSSKVPSLASRIENGTFIPAENISKEVNAKRSDGNKVVPGKGLPLGKDPLIEGGNKMAKNPSKEPIITWDAASANVTPTDPTGAVGPSHFVNAWNSSFRIWDKEGNSLAPAASLSNIWPGETDGDPIVMYDKFADRFIITQFTGAWFGTPGFLIAISEGNDPVNDDWYTYEFSIDAFPDYPKYSVWSDGYYITANKNSGTAGTSNVVYVLERDKIILGDSTAQMVGFPLPDIETSGFYSPLGFNCNGNELPEVGNAPIIYLQDDEWSTVDEDHLKIWTIDVDWDSTEISTISDPVEIVTENFNSVFNGGSFSNLEQPSGPDIDALQATIMYMAQFRKFEDHNSTVLNFVVDLDNDDNRAGIRWYELRQDNDSSAWSIFQEGTYEQPDNHSAFCGSIAMDSLGNIGLGYSVVSSTQSVSIRYTGRFANDPLNQMTLSEGVIEEGSENDPSFRYGDYGQMTIDPSDDLTFWHIAEYFDNSTRVDVVGAFKLVPDFNIDAGIVEINSPNDGELSASETITVSIRNFGMDTIWNVPVSYEIDGGTAVNAIYTDTILPITTVIYSFSETADLSMIGTEYEIKAYTSFVGDEDMSNDTLVKNVSYLFANDIGVSEILSPISGSGLTENESVTVVIENVGSNDQSDFDITYQINSESPVTENVIGPLESVSTMEYTFSTFANLSLLGEYSIKAYSSLSDDIDNSNDTAAVVIENTLCMPSSSCNGGDGIRLFKMTSIDNESGCSPDGYGDYTTLISDLPQGSTHYATFSTNWGNQYMKVWIDLNDNFLFENDEVIVDDFILGLGSGSGSYTDSIEFTVPSDANLGEHLMRAKANWNNGVPSDACSETTYGETEDYTANITLNTGIEDHFSEPNELIILSQPNNQFEILFEAVNTDDDLIITVHNSVGQQVIYNRVNNINGVYNYTFDMSYAAPGVYLVRLGSDKFGKVKKIVVN